MMHAFSYSLVTKMTRNQCLDQLKTLMMEYGMKFQNKFAIEQLLNLQADLEWLHYDIYLLQYLGIYISIYVACRVQKRICIGGYILCRLLFVYYLI